VRVAVHVLLLVEVGQPSHRLEHKRRQEQAQEDHRQAVVLDEAPHG
jgi:hypothetical protein